MTEEEEKQAAAEKQAAFEAAVARWQPVLFQLPALGVKSFSVIRPLLSNAGAEEAVIEELQAEWLTLEAPKPA